MTSKRIFYIVDSQGKDTRFQVESGAKEEFLKIMGWDEQDWEKYARLRK